ncbi:MAG: hypothetical protein WBA91_05655 [Paracoccaceae bacterium]
MSDRITIWTLDRVPKPKGPAGAAETLQWILEITGAQPGASAHGP